MRRLRRAWHWFWLEDETVAELLIRWIRRFLSR
jgi:hypothetical protein